MCFEHISLLIEPREFNTLIFYHTYIHNLNYTEFRTVYTILTLIFYDSYMVILLYLHGFIKKLQIYQRMLHVNMKTGS